MMHHCRRNSLRLHRENLQATPITTIDEPPTLDGTHISQVQFKKTIFNDPNPFLSYPIQFESTIRIQSITHLPPSQHAQRTTNPGRAQPLNNEDIIEI
jgi:hypothetical protein